MPMVVWSSPIYEQDGEEGWKCAVHDLTENGAPDTDDLLYVGYLLVDPAHDEAHAIADNASDALVAWLRGQDLLVAS